MVRTGIKTIMYMRGQMGSTWEQLKQMLQVEKLKLHDEDLSPLVSTEDSNNAAQTPRRPQRANGGTSPTKSLQEFLETGEQMFDDLEESIHAQLCARLKPSSGSVSAPLYITLALLIGATVTTPQEQFMIRIGPLESQLGTSESSIPSIGVPFARLDVRDTEHHDQRSEQDGAYRCSTPTPPRSTDKQKLKSDERAWERRLVQQLMGIHTVSDSGHYDENESYSPESFSSTLPNRSKVHLLMKAPSGLVFQGMLPKQMVVLQEDYPLEDIEAAQWTPHPMESGNTPSTTATNKKVRWPIYHIQVLGPNPGREPTSSDETSFTNDRVVQEEIWYQVGSGIPALSPLL
ncbi:hypothetical protein BGX34_004721 [Mortierella sp. NVP85]|nr:hypothetical protein BGX34_004721 [Mortierella sp. NVP85]